MKPKQSIEPSNELKELAAPVAIDLPTPVVEECKQNPVKPGYETQNLQNLLKQDAQRRVQECAERCAAICQELNVELSARVTILNNQLPAAEALFIAKT